MAKQSAGILLFREREVREFFLVHPGGPFWKNKDIGAWSIPKGEFEDEDPRVAALREFEEETGQHLDADLLELGTVKMKSGKIITAFAARGDADASDLRSNTVPVQWPPRSGKYIQVPEVDRAAWFSAGEARARINPAQVPFIERLIRLL